MNIIIVIFILIYLATLGCYFFSETSGNLKKRAINKIVLASMFMLFAIIVYIINYKFFSYHLIELIAIIFAGIGDITLLYSFTIGGINFIVSNLLFFTYELTFIINNHLPLYNIVYSLISLIIIYSVFIYLSKTAFDLKNKKIPIYLYIFSVCLQACFSISLLISAYSSKILLFSSGLILFMISDYFLMSYTFKEEKKNWILRCNSGTYFVGLLLVVLSLMF